jgi:hypothetical protein
MTGRHDVDESEMTQHPSSDEPRDDRQVDLEGLLDVDEDPRVEELLLAISGRLTVPPDELTTRRHLKAMKRARTGILTHVARRTAGAAAVALLGAGVLAGGGLLPDDMQRGVAEAASRVGIELPRPAEEADEASDGTAGEHAPESVEPPAAERAPLPERVPPDDLPLGDAPAVDRSGVTEDRVPDGAPPSERPGQQRPDDPGRDLAPQPPAAEEGDRARDRLGDREVPAPQRDRAGAGAGDGVRGSDSGTESGDDRAGTRGSDAGNDRAGTGGSNAGDRTGDDRDARGAQADDPGPGTPDREGKAGR